MTDYAWGVLTPFLALAALATGAGLGWLLAALARRLWGATHYMLLGRTTLARNRIRFRLKGEPEDDRREYQDAADRFRDALLDSPTMYTVAGLGWRVLFVRETRTDTETVPDRASA